MIVQRELRTGQCVMQKGQADRVGIQELAQCVIFPAEATANTGRIIRLHSNGLILS